MKKLPDMDLQRSSVEEQERNKKRYRYRELGLENSPAGHQSAKGSRSRFPKIPTKWRRMLVGFGGVVLCIAALSIGFAARFGYERVFPSTEPISEAISFGYEYATQTSPSDVSAHASEDDQDLEVAEDQVNPFESLHDHLYVMYDGVTVDLSPAIVKGFYFEECPFVGACEASVPCVDIENIQEYVDLHLAKALDGNNSVALAQNENGRYYYRSSDFAPDPVRLVQDIESILVQRSERLRQQLCDNGGISVDGEDIAEVTNEIRGVGIEVPGTDGLYSPFYIEIDDSQQHLYLWRDGELIADYEVSGFFDEWAVFGVFKIYNKSPNAWSPTAEKWMPFWMAYHYDKRQAAWLGIHELVWWTDEETGQVIEETSDSIGQKKSGGCIRLDRGGPAEELYNMVEVDMPVLVHP